MSLTETDISSRNKFDIKKHYLWFSMLQLKRSWDKRTSFFFTMKFLFLFSFSCTYFMGTFKNTEYNPICMVFTEVFLTFRISHSTVVIVVRKCSVKKVLLKISQNSQENMCTRTSFLITLPALQNLKEHLFLQNTSGGCLSNSFSS